MRSVESNGDRDSYISTITGIPSITMTGIPSITMEVEHKELQYMVHVWIPQCRNYSDMLSNSTVHAHCMLYH